MGHTNLEFKRGETMLQRWKKQSFVLLTLVFLTGVFPTQGGAVSTSATAAVMMDVDSGRVIYSVQGDTQMRIASTTKLLTALVALEYGNLNDVVTVSQEAAYTEGSSMYLKVGEEVTLEALLYGLLLSSGNDAAVAIAQHVGGSVEAFATLMNTMAQNIGMSNSSFANPNGLDQDGHYSTAYDMALLGCAAVNNPTLVRMASTTSITIGGRTLTNHNRLLEEVDGCIGLKTGYTQAAGRTLVSCVNQNGQRLVVVTLQDGNDWEDHKALYAYGFAQYPANTVVTRGQVVAQVRVGVNGTLSLVAGSTFAYPLQGGETVSVTVEVTDTGGLAVFTMGDAVIGTVTLYNGTTVWN